MILNMLKSKIHRAEVTQAELNYVGSITIDKSLMKAANILNNEKVQIVDINNGARLETYAIEGKENSGVICLNGAAARCVQPGDKVIIIAYCHMEEEEAKKYKPTVVFAGEGNSIKEITNYESN
ncbi:aspartate 1-decarboxylase precursor [Clostridium acetireducens DSM 10703]|jgi:aspartate 1-decarboxylase|uniref:Aspartate 1-decarboxylase n=1 Tax=Clostridium acetireducens DSM 10703 TaxID=1121290 RepID=A0A1E8F0R4_9CLOT|nr:aspartate 1-decarboxylase [Clostridium acetireducens]OFI06755.1 aspartate 1-decarboxylase precursor [Clostridium acetireducens DSM 10703]